MMYLLSRISVAGRDGAAINGHLIVVQTGLPAATALARPDLLRDTWAGALH
ncbi:MAG TPA: hypothetical protein VFB98_01390 [Candidatus Deferrimicrobium sp.]|nr:hypothetical protein [Candidatus Deferrimicrobium sp.]